MGIDGEIKDENGPLDSNNNNIDKLYISPGINCPRNKLFGLT